MKSPSPRAPPTSVGGGLMVNDDSTSAIPPAIATSTSIGTNDGSLETPTSAPTNAAAMEGQIAKFKRLLTLSRQRLEENQRTLTEKNQTIERLSNEVDNLRSRVNMINRSGSSTSGGAVTPPNTTIHPRRALLYVTQGETIWVLFELEDDGEEIWKSFRSEAELQAFIRRDSGEPIRLPPASLSPEASDKIRKEAQHRIDKVQEDLRKYRVRQELAMRQKEAEIKQISAASIAQHHVRIDTPDVEEMAKQLKAQQEKISALRTELAEQEQRWRSAYDKIAKDNEALQGSGADTALASQWRKRYENILREKEDLVSKLDYSGGAPVEQKYQDFKEEYKLYRKKALEALREKDAMIADLGGGGGNGMSAPSIRSTRSSVERGGGVDPHDPAIIYLKNLTGKYFSTESPEIRQHTERAMLTVLQFTEAEIKEIQAIRANSHQGPAEWAKGLFGGTITSSTTSTSNNHHGHGTSSITNSTR